MVQLHQALRLSEVEGYTDLPALTKLLEKYDLQEGEGDLLDIASSDLRSNDGIQEMAVNCFVVLHKHRWIDDSTAGYDVPPALATRIVDHLLVCLQCTLQLSGSPSDANVILHIITMCMSLFLGTGCDLSQVGNDVLSKLLVLVHILHGRCGCIELDSAVLLAASPHEQMHAIRRTPSPVFAEETQRLADLPASSSSSSVPAAFKKSLTLKSNDTISASSAQVARRRLENLVARCDALVRGKATPAVAARDVQAEVSSVYTQAIIGIARMWNSLPSSVESDTTTAHALLSLLRAHCTDAQLPLLQSAGFTAIVPVAMRLLDRYEATLHCLGLYLLLRAANATTLGLLATFQEWILPHIYAHLEIVDDHWSQLLVARLLHALLVSDLHSTVATQYAHLYLESSIRLLSMKPTAEFAWPFLLQLHCCVGQWMPGAVLACHADALLACYLQLLNVWHLPLQSEVMRGLFCIAEHMQRTGCAVSYMPRVSTELVRLLVFYSADQRDISGADQESVAVLVANCSVLAARWRQVDVTQWDAFLASLQGEVSAQIDVTKNAEECVDAASQVRARKQAQLRYESNTAVLRALSVLAQGSMSAVRSHSHCS